VAAGEPLRAEWHDAFAAVVARTRRAAGGRPLRVALVDAHRIEYETYWLAPVLYDERRIVPRGVDLPAADLAIAPAGYAAACWTCAERRRIRGDLVRDVLLPE
jgi:hypothetical protein